VDPGERVARRATAELVALPGSREPPDGGARAASVAREESAEREPESAEQEHSSEAEERSPEQEERSSEVEESSNAAAGAAKVREEGSSEREARSSAAAGAVSAGRFPGIGGRR